MPLDYEKPLPDGYKVAELQECILLYFQSEPYENTDNFGTVIGQVMKTVEKYDFKRYGYRLAHQIAPTAVWGQTLKLEQESRFLQSKNNREPFLRSRDKASLIA